MQVSKLIIFLQSIDKPMLRQLEIALHSPYFKLRPKAVLLFDYLVKFYPDFDPKKTDPAYIEAKQPQIGNRENQNKYRTEIMDAIALFFAFEQLQKNPAAVKNYCISGLAENALQETFLYQYQQLQKMLDADPDKDFDYFYQQHLLIEASFNGYNSLLNRNAENDLNPVLDSLDAFYAVKKLRYMQEAFNRSKVVGTPFYPKKLKGLFETLAPYDSPDFPYVYLFLHIFKMDSSESFAEGKVHYDLIKNYILNHPEAAHSDTTKESLGFLDNWCLEWNAKGNLEAAAEFLGWVAWKEEHNLLLLSGKILPALFRNIVGIAAFLNKETTWVQAFIHKYESFMPEEHREINMNFVNGILHFMKKDYLLSIAFFEKAEARSETIFGGMIRRWGFAPLYQLNKGDIETLTKYLDAFDKFIQRNSDGLHIYKRPFSQYIRYCKKLLKADQPEEKQQLLEILETEDFFLGKYWIAEQLLSSEAESSPDK